MPEFGQYLILVIELDWTRTRPAECKPKVLSRRSGSTSKDPKLFQEHHPIRLGMVHRLRGR